MHHPRLLNRNSKMNNLTMSHDTQLFSRMRDILVPYERKGLNGG